MTTYHPQKNDKGQPVEIKKPCTSTPLDAWSKPAAVATVIPGGLTPPSLNGIAFDSWTPPATAAEWANVPGQAPIEEPEFKCPPGLKPAAGCVVEEADGRIWLVSPTNQFGGYTNTFPKGRPDGGATLQACAIRECFEEAGVRVEITGHLDDLERSTTYTRYYKARRLSGNPADMGWESQAVHLVPRSTLAAFLTNKNDEKFVDLLKG
jgi:ADP-ribose pyrophosphatase YjhB (NUDIX family)